jgi:hypothetical protein
VVDNLHAQRELHAVEKYLQRWQFGGFDEEPGFDAVVQHANGEFEATHGVKQQHLGGFTGRERAKLLAGDGVEPGQAIGAEHPEHAVVREVDYGTAGDE